MQKKLINFELNTTLLGEVMCVSLYESALDGDEWFDRAYSDAIEDGITNFEIVFNTRENEKCVERALETVLEEHAMPYLSKYGVTKIKLGEWFHPREYNFYGDHVGLLVTVDEGEFFSDKAWDKIASWKDNEKIGSFIKDHFAERSGFIPFGPQSLPELMVDLMSTRTHYAIAMYIGLLLVDEFGEDYLQSQLEGKYFDNTCNVELAYYITSEETE